MVLEVGVEHYLVHEAGCVLHSGGIGGGVGAVECQVEMEVGVFLFELEEVVEIEHLVEGARTVEVVHFAVGGVEGLGHVHDLGAQGCHAGAAAYPYHLGLGVEVGVEIAVGAAHHHLVAGLEGEDVAGGDAGIHVHEPYFGFWLERRGGYAHREHEAVAFSRVVGHGIGAHGCLGIDAFEREEAEFLPCRQIFVADGGFVDILVVVDAEGWNLDLCV